MELRGTDEAEIPSGFPGGEEPGDFFHIFLAGETPVLAERAFTGREVDFALDKEGSARDFLFGNAESTDDVAAGACPAQGFDSFQSPSFDSNRDHILFVSNKPCASVMLRVRPRTQQQRSQRGRTAI